MTQIRGKFSHSMHKNRFIILLAFFMSHGLPSQATSPLYPDNVGLNSKSFDPRKGQVVTLNFQPSQRAEAVVQVYNFIGEKVKTIFNEEVKKGSVYKAAWNGRSGSGKRVLPGVYYYTISLKNKEAAMTYNPYPETHGRLLSILEGGYDEKTNQIYFKLPQAAMVRVRINIQKGGPIMASPLDWTPLPVGEYRFPWDGKDVSGFIDIKNHPDLNIMIYAYTLSDNSFIVAGVPVISGKPFVPLNEAAMLKQDFPLNIPADRYIHARKDPRLNRVARIEVTFPGAKIKKGLPVLSGKTAVRIAIDPRDQWLAEMSRYELMFYLDTVVVFEDESGFAPFTYYLNTQDLTEGEHVLTVNLLTYDDHYAVISKKVVIRHEKDKKI